MTPSALGASAWGQRRRPVLWGAPLLVVAFLAGMLLEPSAATRSQDGRSGSVEPDDVDLRGAATGTFRVASFNVLGANHTVRGGTHPGFASGSVRTEYLVRLLDLRGLDVAGLQELQRSQFDRFMSLTRGAWGVYPGNKVTNYATHNSIVWRAADWELLQARTLPIPYFGGKKVPMPFVLLRNIDSGRLVWFANFHNPASGKRRGDQSRWRAEAARLEVALANSLWNTGAPLVLTGDMNERGSYFCKMTTQAPMKSASGGSFGSGPCRPPRDARIDWVFGSSFVQFSGYQVRRGELIRKTTDHPMIVADVTVPLRPRS